MCFGGGGWGDGDGVEREGKLGMKATHFEFLQTNHQIMDLLQGSCELFTFGGKM